ncbi:hypothetical protein CDD81_1759 [Ophiocordyceps australis]|uniref:YCII-related domain-containing protein n=1 Tax=Ophiocordyceps australis TaxID=1399860 RepID=A0A2C5YDI3_9HYPO|nr:hypothetical protein CDD81_1759 [Ophiocordyceps australis]
MFSLLSRSRALPRSLALVPQQLRASLATTSKAHRAEYFVNIWDKPGIDRSAVADKVDVPASFHLVGEILDEQTLKVRGNCLACVCASEQEVVELLRHTPYYKQGVWDMSTAKISALETVHTSNLVGETEKTKV